MPLTRRPLLDIPIALLKVIDDGGGDLVLLVLGQQSPPAADQAEPFGGPLGRSAAVRRLAPHDGGWRYCTWQTHVVQPGRGGE